MPDESEHFPLALPIASKPYRTLLLFSKHGKTIAYLTGAIVLLGAVALWWSGFGPAWLAAGVVIAAFAVLMMNCFAELIDLIVDTMIPK
ncbi:MAG: hypothetical protein ACOY5F_13270 [Pseudomonadota bacterium]